MRSVLGFCFVVLFATFAQIGLVCAAPVSPGSRAVEKRICYGDCREAVVEPAASSAPAAPVTSSPIPVAEPVTSSLFNPSPDDADSGSADPDSVPPTSVPASPARLAPAPTEQELLSMVNTMLQLIQAYEVDRATPAPAPNASAS